MSHEIKFVFRTFRSCINLRAEQIILIIGTIAWHPGMLICTT